MKSIFISRKLNEDSVFKSRLKAAGFEVHGISLLKFSAVNFTELPPSDWIFFYSKNGVKFFFEGLKKQNIPIPELMRWGTIGKGTAAFLKQYIPQVDFIGNGNTMETAANFLKAARGLNVLFPQAEKSRRTIQRILEQNIKYQDLIVYKNEPKAKVNIPDCNILVFTSPMNVNAYFKKRVLFDDQKVFAIGRTTAKALVSIGIEEFNIAEEPTEEALVQAVL